MEDNEKLKKLQQQRKEHGERERAQLNLWRKWEAERQQKFDVALQSESLLHIQFLNDLQINSEKLTEWHGKAKNDAQRKQLLAMIQALWRVQTYTTNMETLAKAATADLLMERKKARSYANRLHDAEKEIKALKAEIQHYVDEEEERSRQY